MLKITIPETENWDEVNECFVYSKEQVLSLEHSLVSVYKWESKWHKPFLETKLTTEEMVDYIRCMTLTQNVDPNAFYNIDQECIKKINDYIHDPMTATWFSEKPNNKGSRQIVTAEIIYYWMISLQIPMECQKWHLNKLITLIRVCNEKNSPPKKMSKREIMERNKSLNEARRKAMGQNG